MRDELAKRIEKAFTVVEKMEPGTVIPHMSMGELLGEQRKNRDGRYYRLVSSLKKRLIHAGIFVKTATGIGYQIVHPGDEMPLQEGKIARHARSMRKVVIDSQHINLDKITDNTKRAYTIEAGQRMSNLVGMLSNAYRVQLEA